MYKKGFITQFVSAIHPRHLTRVLQTIDAEREEVTSFDWHTPAVLIMATVFLLLAHTMANMNLQYHVLTLSATLFNTPIEALSRSISSGRFAALIPHLEWASSYIVCYLVLPIVVIKTVFKQPLSTYGLQVGRLKEHYHWYIPFAALSVIIFIISASTLDDFSNYYPFYTLAHRSYADLLLWESMYLLHFIAVEFFFRGFLVSGLRPAFGSNAIFVMCIPYMMIHLGKPWLEATGSIGFGLALGLLALRTRSIWGGVFVHVCSALAMDLTALIVGKGLPTHFWP